MSAREFLHLWRVRLAGRLLRRSQSTDFAEYLRIFFTAKRVAHAVVRGIRHQMPKGVFTLAQTAFASKPTLSVREERHAKPIGYAATAD
jgi:hypothetical protein